MLMPMIAAPIREQQAAKHMPAYRSNEVGNYGGVSEP
jgi:hypothetical protein